MSFAPNEYGLILLSGSSDGNFALHEYKSKENNILKINHYYP